MEDDEIKELSITMSNLGDIDASIVERLFVEFADQISSTGSLVGTLDSTERLLLGSLDKDKGRYDYGGNPGSSWPNHVG